MEYYFMNHIFPSTATSLFLLFFFLAFSSSIFLFKFRPYPNTKTKKFKSAPEFPSSPIFPTNWPILRMLPSIIENFPRLLLYVTSLQLQSNGSIMLRGPWFTKMELFFTSDLANIQHIASKHYDDFHKGYNFNKIFDVFGDGIFNVDDHLWKYQRKIAHAAFTGPQFRKLLTTTIRRKVDENLIPILARACREGTILDLQDLFTRYTSDVTFITIMGHDPGSLSLDFPENPVCNHIHFVEGVLLRRHVVPDVVWRLQRWLGVGNEKKCSQSVEATERIMYDCIQKTRDEIKLLHHQNNGGGGGGVGGEEGGRESTGGMDLLRQYIIEKHGTPEHGFESNTKFLRDTLATFLSAGQDTTSVALAWFFWLMSNNPEAETKLKQELQEKIILNTTITTTTTADHTNNTYDSQESSVNKLVYLHGAICETLRLYPPVPLNHKASLNPIVLPSGHKVHPWTKIILNCYGMGRMRSIWGDDCLEFKPERWITDQGTIRYEPSHKFFSFNAGPRICLGKEMSLLQMKAAIATIYLNGFKFRVIEGQDIEPGLAIVLSMKYGCKVRVVKGDD